MTSFEDLKAQGLSDATASLHGRHDMQSLVEPIQEWFAETTDVYAGNRSKIAEHPATKRLATQLNDAGLADVADHLRRFGEETGPIHPGMWLFALLLGKARAAAFVQSLSNREWYEANLWGHESFGGWESYKDEIARLLLSDDALRETAWAFANELIEQARNDPSHHAFHRGDRTSGLKKAFDDYLAKPEIKEAWETPLDGYILFQHAFLLKLLGRIDRDRYLHALARLPHPVFIDQALRVASPATDLAPLISAAPVAFGDGGVFLHAGMVVIALLRTAEAHIRHQAWEGRDGPVLYAVEDTAAIEAAAQSARSAIRPVLHAAFARQDAVPLGWAWLEHLIFEAQHRGYWRIDRQQGNGIALDAVTVLIHEIAQRLAVRADDREWILGNEPLWRIERLMAVLAVGLWGRGKVEGYVEDRLNWALLDLAVEFSGADHAVARSDGIVGQIGMACLLSNDDPAGSLRSLWHRIRPTRERAWRPAGSPGVGKNDVGQLLAFWGLRMFELSDAPPRARVEPVLEFILRDAYQTEPAFGLNEFWSEALRRFARKIEMPSASDPGKVVQRVAAFLLPYMRPDALCLSVILALAERGIEREMLRQAVQTTGADLDRLVTTFFDIEGLRIRHRVYPQPWLEKVRDLASLPLSPKQAA